MASPTDLKKGRQFSVLSAAAFGTLESLTEDVDGIEARLKVVEEVAAGVEIKLEAGRCLSTALPRRAGWLERGGTYVVISQGLISAQIAAGSDAEARLNALGDV